MVRRKRSGVFSPVHRSFRLNWQPFSHVWQPSSHISHHLLACVFIITFQEHWLLWQSLADLVTLVTSHNNNHEGESISLPSILGHAGLRGHTRAYHVATLAGRLQVTTLDNAPACPGQKTNTAFLQATKPQRPLTQHASTSPAWHLNASH